MLVDPGLPLVGYRFVVVIFTGILLPNPVDIQFQEVSGLKLARNLSYETGMMTVKERNSAERLSMKRGIFTSPSPLVTGNVVESLFWESRMLRKDIMVSALDGNDNPVNSWLVSNAYLASWKWDNLNATNNQILIENLTFTYTDIKYVPLKMTKTG